MSWKDNAATRAVKKYALSTAIFVASVFGGGATKAAAAERDEAPTDKIEVVESPQQQNEGRKSKRTYTFTRSELPQSRQASQTNQSRQASRTTHNNQTAQTRTQNLQNAKNLAPKKKKQKSAMAETIENRINETQRAFSNIVDSELRHYEMAGARRLYEIYDDYLHKRNQARANAIAEQESDKRFAEDFEIIVANALVFKYQVDRGHGLREYIPYDTRKNIINKAKAHGKNLYKLLRRDANEDAILDYMGSALEGVECTPKQNYYEYKGKEATIHENLVRTMGVKNNNYTIGGRRYSR